MSTRISAPKPKFICNDKGHTKISVFNTKTSPKGPEPFFVLGVDEGGSGEVHSLPALRITDV